MNTKYKNHGCNSLPDEGIWIVYDNHYSKRKEFVWCLIIERKTTETDLDENHHLEEIGQTIWYTQFEISHCPFCGEKLFDPSENGHKDDGQFLHVDASGWQWQQS